MVLTEPNGHGRSKFINGLEKLCITMFFTLCITLCITLCFTVYTVLYSCKVHYTECNGLERSQLMNVLGRTQWSWNVF